MDVSHPLVSDPLGESGWTDLNRKRGREDEYADIAAGGKLGFTEHRSKRVQALPLRTPPPSNPGSTTLGFPTPVQSNYVLAQPTAMTPPDSDPDSVNHAACKWGACYSQTELGGGTWSISSESIGEREMSFALEPEFVREDMDMTDSPESFPHVMAQLDPSQPSPNTLNAAGRIPTPIDCSFASQVKGSNWGGTAGDAVSFPGQLQQSGASGGLGSSQREPYPGESVISYESVPRSLDGAVATASVTDDWDMVQTRRLPSPISEQGGEECFEGFETTPSMVHASSTEQVNRHGHRHPLLSSLPPRANSAMEISSASTASVPPRARTPNAVSDAPDRGLNGSAMDVDPSTTPSPRKGHTRSRHTLNSWTVQPGMKKSFSIGYRADCEKCRMRIPGHFNHIVIS